MQKYHIFILHKILKYELFLVTLQGFCTYFQHSNFQRLSITVKRIIIALLYISIAIESFANITLPWDSLFSNYGLSNSMSIIPAYINPTFDLQYNNGYSAGLWGLTPPIARKYGLKITEEIDERYDLQLSSIVAAKYLKDLLAYYGNEDIAKFAYINGASLIVEIASIYNIDLHNTSEDDIKKLCSHLPKNSICDTITIENTNYLDSAFNHTGYIKYKFNHPIRKTTLQDSIFFSFGLANAQILPSARWISEMFIPETFNKAMLDTIYENEIIAYNEELVAIEKTNIAQEKKRIAAIKKANAVKIYVVKSGDTLGHIAKRHKVTVTQLKKWNGLKSDFLRVGQKIKIHNS